MPSYRIIVNRVRETLDWIYSRTESQIRIIADPGTCAGATPLGEGLPVSPLRLTDTRSLDRVPLKVTDADLSLQPIGVDHGRGTL